MKIEIKNNRAYVDGRIWSKKKIVGDLGDYVMNILFYVNRNGEHNYSLIVNGIDETEEFKNQVKKEYEGIKNTTLRDSFFKYAKVI